jgi:hypothetical protein
MTTAWENYIQGKQEEKPGKAETGTKKTTDYLAEYLVAKENWLSLKAPG